MNDITARAIALRRKLHRWPELAGCEERTCRTIREALAEIPGVRVLPPFLRTDTVALIDGAAPGRNVTLRADIDGLPVAESSGAEFASERPGFMHACGHDVHTAILFGAAAELAARRGEFVGSVRLAFQPGEESMAMANELILAGALRDPRPDFVAALHVEPGLPCGTIGVRKGAMASGCLHFQVDFYGCGGHGSMPHAARNPIPAAVAAISELQYIVNQQVDAQKPAVVSICAICGGEADNIIPEHCCFKGTLRAFDVETSELLYTAVREICDAAAKMHRVRCEVTAPGGKYPPVVNSESGVKVALAAAKAAGLPVRELVRPSMSSEDFSYFLLDAPDGVFVRLGAGEEQPPLHSADFLPPQEVIPAGIRYLTAVALAALH